MTLMRAPTLPISTLFALVFVSAVGAQPQIPATFYGSVTIEGEIAPAGTEIRALVNGNDCTQAQVGERPVVIDGPVATYVLYVVHETQRPGCAREGSTIAFTIDGNEAKQSAKWVAGPVRLDLSIGEGDVIPLPEPPPTVAAPPASSTAQVAPSPATAVTASGRPTGTPPTDDVTFQKTPQPPGSGQDGQTPGAGDSNGAGILLLVILGTLAVAGAAAGIALARRRRFPADTP